MILSMTGFGKAEKQSGSKTITVEVKSLNSKNADIKIRVPNLYRSKELEIRNLVIKRLERGKIDLIVSIDDQNEKQGSTINEEKFMHYHAQLKQLATKTDSKADLFGLALRMPEVVESAAENLDEEEWKTAIAVIDQALFALIDFRKTEGAQLKADFANRLASINNALNEVATLAPERSKVVEERLTQKIEELNSVEGDDQNRLHQEVVYYMEKFDLNEEIVRLSSHLKYFTETIDNKESAGKKLGFIGQEMGREINTIGSKANHAEIQKLVVLMKDELEKIKEQALNVL